MTSTWLCDLDEAIISRFERFVAYPLIDCLGISLLWQWRVATAAWLFVGVRDFVMDRDLFGRVLGCLFSLLLVTQLAWPDNWGSCGAPYFLNSSSRGANPNRLLGRNMRIFSYFALAIDFLFWILDGRISAWIWLWALNHQISGCNPRPPRRILEWGRKPAGVKA